MNPRNLATTVLATLAVALCGCGSTLFAQGVASAQGRAAHSSPAPSSSPAFIFLPSAQFQIPFNVDRSGPVPAVVQLLVSTDEGAKWQLYSQANPGDRQFDFRAAGEGDYLFKVQSLDATGAAFPSTDLPMRVRVDLTKPQAWMHAELDRDGNLIVGLRVFDHHLALDTALIRMCTDSDPQWRAVQVTTLSPVGQFHEGQLKILVPPCREVAVVFSIQDLANNVGEASLRFTMPTTSNVNAQPKVAQAIVGPGVTLPFSSAPGSAFGLSSGSASADSAPPATQSMVGWDVQRGVPSRLAHQSSMTAARQFVEGAVSASSAPNQPDSTTANRADQPFHCRSRTFSLDYSVEALGGNGVTEVELWGSEDGGRTWQKWGSDPDRTSPFDVKVANDGLFGFRMILVGANGTAVGNTQPGDAADAWLYVDTAPPTCKITQAVAGVGSESGMLLVNYACNEEVVPDQAALSWSVSPEGPWTRIVDAQQLPGSYRWRPDPGISGRIYLKLDVVDRAGNIGTHRLEYPVGLQIQPAPRGRIQGIRPR